MEKNFFRFDKQNLKYSDALDIAELYAKVYSAPPWNEDWNTKSALNEIDEVITKQGFTGLFLKKEKIIGFSWGYRVPEFKTTRVNFEYICDELEKKCINPKNTFYGADTGVAVEERGQGLATKLIMQRSLNENDIMAVIFRTKNPTIVDIYRKIFGKEVFSFPEETAYKGGRVYVMSTKSLKFKNADDYR